MSWPRWRTWSSSFAKLRARKIALLARARELNRAKGTAFYKFFFYVRGRRDESRLFWSHFRHVADQRGVDPLALPLPWTVVGDLLTGKLSLSNVDVSSCFNRIKQKLLAYLGFTVGPKSADDPHLAY